MHTRKMLPPHLYDMSQKENLFCLYFPCNPSQHLGTAFYYSTMPRTWAPKVLESLLVPLKKPLTVFTYAQ